MKTQRICALFMIIMLVFLSVPSTIYARVNVGATEHPVQTPTDRRNAFEFCELYASRYRDFTKDGACIDEPIIPFVETEQGFFVSVTAGLLGLDLETYNVDSLDMTMQSAIFTEDTNQEHIISFVTALSALEYDYLAGTLMPYETMLTGKSYDPTTKAVQLWLDVIMPAYEETKRKSEYALGEKFLIYSENYDYYLVCTEYQSSFVYSIVAEARK